MDMVANPDIKQIDAMQKRNVMDADAQSVKTKRTAWTHQKPLSSGWKESEFVVASVYKYTEQCRVKVISVKMREI